MAYVRFDNVTLIYPNHSTRPQSFGRLISSFTRGGSILMPAPEVTTAAALKDVSFNLSDGDAVGLVGQNGAGKTTLLRTIAGIYRPTSGRVDKAGSVATIIELGAGLDSELSGYENIFRMALLRGFSVDETNMLLPSIEQFTELGGFLDAPVRTYSSGMLMRLMFAVSTANKPDILLVDEIMATGDMNFQGKAQQRMQNVLTSAKIFVFASHSTELIDRYCNRVFELKRGELRELN